LLSTLFEISLSVSIIVIGLLVFLPLFKKRYSYQWWYVIWIILAVRLLIPIQWEVAKPIVAIPIFKEIALPEENKAMTTPFTLDAIDHTPITDSMQQKGQAFFANLSPFALIWLLGFMAFISFHAIGYLRFQKNILRGCKEIVMTGYLPILVCDKISSPMLVGFFSPKILLPHTDYTPEERSMILCHEQTHYKRHDLWYKLILILANAVHWFNPLVYVLVHFANRDLEFSCDDLVVKNEDLSFCKAYSNTILKTSCGYNRVSLSTQLNGGKKNMKKRFSNIFDQTTKKRGLFAISAILSLSLVAGSMVGCRAITPDGTVKEVTLADAPEGIHGILSEKERNPALEQLLIQYFEIPEDYQKDTRYYYNYIDLNQDNVDEIFVVAMGTYTSGSGGSSALIVTQKDDKLEVMQNFTLIQTPIFISDTATNGYRDIIVNYTGGGILHDNITILKNQNGIYPNVPDGTPLESVNNITGTLIICDDIVKDMEAGISHTLESK